MKQIISTMQNLYPPFLRLAPYFFWLLLLVTTLLLLIELAPSGSGFPHLDKIVHASLFGALSFLGAITFHKKALWLYISLVIYGALTEWLQGVLTVTRYPSILDWSADCVGILLGMLLINYFKQPTTKEAVI